MARVDKGRMEEELRTADQIRTQMDNERAIVGLTVLCCGFLCIVIASVTKNEATLLVTVPVGILISWFASIFAKQILILINYTLLIAFIGFIVFLAYVMITGQVKSDRTIEDIKTGISKIKFNE